MEDKRSDNAEEGVKERKRLSDGVYVKGKVEGVELLFTADTGAARSVLSSRIYRKIEESQRPKLAKCGSLRGANGSPIAELGKAEFSITVGSYEMVHEVVVADIEDDALLGFNILRGSEKGPADLLLSKGMIVLDGVEIPCLQVGRAEALVDVYVEREKVDDFDKYAEYLVEPSENFRQRYQLVMASSLVDINKGPTCKVRELNPFPTEVRLHQNAHIGGAEQIEKINEWDIGLTNLAEHPIDTGYATPIKQRPRRVPLAFASEEKAAIDDLLKKMVQDCLDAVAGVSLFSSFDLTSGYFQIPLKKEDIPKSAFTCKYGLFDMKRIPFGLSNSSSTFQKTMELVLQGLQWQTCLVYIDDIIVFGADFSEHIQRVDEVLDRIKQADMKLLPDKCHMLQTEVVFLGHVVSKEGIRPDPTNIAKIAEWPRPTTPKQIKQIVATGSYYRRYIRDFAKVARPLIELTKKDACFAWTEECEKAFMTLKKKRTDADVMGFPLNEGGEFYLDVDASGTGIGGVLSQVQSDQERVIAYASRSLNKAERNYCMTERELLAIVYFTQYFRQYLLGRKFTVRSDHQALIWLKEPNGKIARWIEILASFNFSIEYRPGKLQPHCDALSRCDSPRDCDYSEVYMSEPLKCGHYNKCRRRAEIMVLNWRKGEDSQENNVDSSGEENSEALSCARKSEVASSQVREVNTDEPRAGTSSESTDWTMVGAGKTTAELRARQLEDSDIKPVLEAKEEGKKPAKERTDTMSPCCRHYLLLWDQLKVADGVLLKEFIKRDRSGTYGQVIVPEKVKREILQSMHGGLLAGLMGTKKTKAKILQRFYWFNLREDVKLFIRQCDICARDKKPPKPPRAAMGSVRTGAPWDVLATDYLGPFPITPRGNRYILVLTDHFSKFVEVIAVPDQTAETCANKIVNEFVCRWGCPVSILSDQGRTYESKVFQELCRLLGVKKVRTSVRNPRCNGQVERFNRTLVRMIRAYLLGVQEDWDLNLGCLAGAYRVTSNESTKLTPNLLTMGREVRLPAELVFGSTTNKSEVPVTSYGDYVDGIRSKMNHAHDIARKHRSQLHEARRYMTKGCW
ncbi:uncharacterized protein LOC123522917 [Mercenaria mercenaria]|uniref:uncharacterized protein LOC123522917 n=1 Tax=Mercenaria mercenaria TaxID=6596 RepID=UPI00234F2DE9|nr:uncharacterized protein LOC123522917 [Mercenaria mercenaria]